MKTTEYLAAAKIKLNARRNTELAKALNVSSAALTLYEQDKRVMDDYTAAQVAKVLGIEPMRIIAQANAEREKDEKKKAFWEAITMGGIAAGVFLMFGTSFVPHDTTNLLTLAGFVRMTDGTVFIM